MCVLLYGTLYEEKITRRLYINDKASNWRYTFSSSILMLNFYIKKKKFASTKIGYELS